MSERQKILVKFSLEIFPYLHLKGQKNVKGLKKKKKQRGYRECIEKDARQYRYPSRVLFKGF